MHKAPGDHRVQVLSQSAYLPARISDFCASTKVPVSRDLWPWPWPWTYPGCALTCRPSCASLVAIRPFASEKRFSCQHKTAAIWSLQMVSDKTALITWALTLTLTLSTSWMQAHLQTFLCNFGSDRAIFGVVEAICAKKTLQTDRHTHTDRVHRRQTPRDFISSRNELQTISYYEIRCDANNSVELVAVDVMFGSRKYRFVNVYRSPLTWYIRETIC